MKILKPALYLFAILGFIFFIRNISTPSVYCDVNNLAITASPNAQYQAKLQIRKCSNEPSPMVTLSVSSSAKPNEEETMNVGLASTTDFDVTWISDHRLQIYYPQSFRPEHTFYPLNGVEIIWKSRPNVNDQ